MKTAKYLVLLLGLFVLAQCKSKQPVFQDQPLLQNAEVYVQDWVGGQPGSAGTNITIEIDNPAEIAPDTMYYHQRIVPVEVRETNGKTLWMGRFITLTRREPDPNEDPNTDVSVKVPECENFPFDLKDDEIVLRYRDKKGSYYYKWETVKKKKSIYYPTTKPKPQMD